MHFIQGSLHIDMCKQSLEQGLEFQPLLSPSAPLLHHRKGLFLSVLWSWGCSAQSSSWQGAPTPNLRADALCQVQTEPLSSMMGRRKGFFCQPCS